MDPDNPWGACSRVSRYWCARSEFGYLFRSSALSNTCVRFRVYRRCLLTLCTLLFTTRTIGLVLTRSGFHPELFHLSFVRYGALAFWYSILLHTKYQSPRAGVVREPARNCPLGSALVSCSPSLVFLPDLPISVDAPPAWLVLRIRLLLLFGFLPWHYS